MPFMLIVHFCRRASTLTKGVSLTLLLLLNAHEVFAADVIKVGVYRFPPFVDFNNLGEPEGLSLDILKRLNKIQDGYRFEPVVTSPGARYADFSASRFDMMIFENVNWGWTQRNLPVVQTPQFMSGGERYITLSQPGRTQNYFDDLSNKTIACIAGYHYGFAGFKDDPGYLRQKFGARLVRRADELILALLSGHADIAVVTETLLFKNFATTPGLKAKILVSDRYDQVYSHRVVLRKDIALSIADMADLMDRLVTDPAYLSLIENYRGKP